MSTVSPPGRPLALVVEDETLILMETLDLLQDHGFAVLEAYHADRALEQLADNPSVKLLVTDVRMPGPIDGFALAREAHRLYPHLSIIVCSGQRRTGPDDLPAVAVFIDKPLSAPALARGVRGFKLSA